MLLSSTYNFVEVESKNIFGFKNYLNLGTTARIANVKGFDEFNKSALIRNLDISKLFWISKYRFTFTQNYIFVALL